MRAFDERSPSAAWLPVRAAETKLLPTPECVTMRPDHWLLPCPLAWHTQPGMGHHTLVSVLFPVLVRVLVLGTSPVLQPNDPLWSSTWGGGLFRATGIRLSELLFALKKKSHCAVLYLYAFLAPAWSGGVHTPEVHAEHKSNNIRHWARVATTLCPCIHSTSSE